MFDFVLFFLIFLPAMDLIRQFSSIGQVNKFLITTAITALTGSYFIYASVLAGKFADFL